MIKEILKLIDAYWKFDEAQQPMSSWHDKQDLLTAIEQLKNCNLQNVSINENEGKKKKYHRSKCTFPGGDCIWDKKCNSCWYFR